MARLKQSDIKETWVSKMESNRHYYITRNHRVVRVEGKAFASAKMMYICAKSEDDNTAAVNFRGRGVFAHVDNDPQVREYLIKFCTEVPDAKM